MFNEIPKKNPKIQENNNDPNTKFQTHSVIEYWDLRFLPAFGKVFVICLPRKERSDCTGKIEIWNLIRKKTARISERFLSGYY